MSERYLIVYGVAFFSLYFHCHDGTNFVCSYYIHFFLIDCHFIHRSCLKQTDTLSISLFLHTHTLTHSPSHTHNNYCQSHDGTELSGVFICDDIAEPIEQLNDCVSLFTLMPNSFTHCFLVQIIFFS